ncbi:cytidine deaminase [Marinilabiliaceae bacterium ANBcel2]|nr:cytidine deaminase [Marinilabiliaceae bacterium ANBcel2]
MKELILKIAVTEFDNLNELNSLEYELLNKAIKAAGNAYSPYSNFKVGSALLLHDNRVVTGNNQENAAFPAGICAEQVALSNWGANFSHLSIKLMVVVALKNEKLTDEVITPCGECRQVMAEVAMRNGDFPLILAGKNRILKFEKSVDLLPLSFMNK